MIRILGAVLYVVLLSCLASCSSDSEDMNPAVPAGKNNWAFLSSGTWALCGVEVSEAIINDKSFEYPFTNEGGVEGTIRLLKNIMGLWLVQECKRQWEREGEEGVEVGFQLYLGRPEQGNRNIILGYGGRGKDEAFRMGDAELDFIVHPATG